MTLLMTLLIVFLGIFFNNLPRFPIRPNDRTPIERSTHPKLSDVSIFPSLKFLQKDNQDDLNKAYKIYTQQLQRKQQEIKQIHTLKSPPSNREKILEEKELRLENYKNFVKRREIEIANKEKQLQLEKEKQEKFFQEQTKILEDKDKDLQEQKQRNETEIQQQKKEFEETKAQEKRQRIILSIVQLLFSKWRPLK